LKPHRAYDSGGSMAEGIPKQNLKTEQMPRWKTKHGGRFSEDSRNLFLGSIIPWVGRNS